MRTGRVYKIIHEQLDIVYIGSTFNKLRDRFYRHRSHYKLWLGNNNTKGLSIYSYFKEHDITQFKIMLIKEYEVIDRKHLQSYEQLHINKLRKNAVNLNNSFCIKKFYNKQYNMDNADKKREINKRYYIENMDKIKATSKRNYQKKKASQL